MSKKKEEAAPLKVITVMLKAPTPPPDNPALRMRALTDDLHTFEFVGEKIKVISKSTGNYVITDYDWYLERSVLS